jgi:hypothetical protein
MPASRSLDVQREEYARRRLLAMPLAGTVAWLAVAVAGLTLSPGRAALALFVATGSIVYLGMFFSRFTGEHFLDKTRPSNAFDALFFHTVGMSLLVYGIAIPFFIIDLTSLPLTVGILAGLMWLPLSWIIQHWVGIFHAAVRTVGIVSAWYVFPDDRFVVVPLVVVAVYVVTIVVLERRWRAIGLRPMS